MTDLVKVLREYKELMAGLSPEVIAWLEELATKSQWGANPTCYVSA